MTKQGRTWPVAKGFINSSHFFTQYTIQIALNMALTNVLGCMVLVAGVDRAEINGCQCRDNADLGSGCVLDRAANFLTR